LLGVSGELKVCVVLHTDNLTAARTKISVYNSYFQRLSLATGSGGCE
jgi:hypothetical protein